MQLKFPKAKDCVEEYAWIQLSAGDLVQEKPSRKAWTATDFVKQEYMIYAGLYVDLDVLARTTKSNLKNKHPRPNSSALINGSPSYVLKVQLNQLE